MAEAVVVVIFGLLMLGFGVAIGTELVDRPARRAAATTQAQERRFREEIHQVMQARRELDAAEDERIRRAEEAEHLRRHGAPPPAEA